jgi:adenylate cyclase
MTTPALSAVAGDHRVVRSFAFIDLCGFTDFVDAHGDEAGVAELRRLRSTVREVAPLCGVRVDKWLGDGVMLVGVESEPLVAAVVTIEEWFRRQGHLAIRAGLAAGPVILLEGDDYVGRAVNLASRLCDRAEAGQILAAEHGLSLPEGVEVTDRAHLDVRGMATPMGVLTIAGEGARQAGRQAIQSLMDGLTKPIRQLRPTRP